MKRNTPTEERKPNIQWLKDRVAAQGFTQRSLALATDIDHSVISRIFSGHIDVPASRVCALANALAMSSDDLLRMLGYEVSDSQRVRLMGTIKADGTIKSSGAGKYVTPPPGAEAFSALMFDADTKLAGALAFLGRPASADSAVGGLCLIDDDGPPRLRVLQKSTSRRLGTFNLEPPHTGKGSVEEDAAVRTVQRVTLIKP